MPFLMTMPMRPRVPTIATKSKVLPVTIMVMTMPTATIGMVQKIINGLR